MSAFRTDEIPLDEWANDNGVPLRTANSWAKSGKIKAKKQTALTTVTVTRKVRKYFVSQGETVPE